MGQNKTILLSLYPCAYPPRERDKVPLSNDLEVRQEEGRTWPSPSPRVLSGGCNQHLPSMAASRGLNPRRQPLLPWLPEALSVLAPLGRSYWLSSENNSAQNCYVFLCGLTGLPVMRENTSSKSRQLNSKALHQRISLQDTVTHQ